MFRELITTEYVCASENAGGIIGGVVEYLHMISQEIL